MTWAREWTVDGEHSDSEFEERIAFPDSVGGASLRLDLYLTHVFPEMSRSRIQNALCEVRINGREARPSSPVFRGDRVEVALAEDDALHLEPENIPLDILHEDGDVWVISKQRGLVVHPGAGNSSGTLAAGLLYRLGDLAKTTDPLRPGIVHRLDKETSGVMIAAKTREALDWLSAQFRERETRKYYVAVCRVLDTRLSSGDFENLAAGIEVESEISRDTGNRTKYSSLPLGSGRGGKYAASRVQLLGLNPERTHALFRVRILTGRTHQVRLHLSGLGFPILGDPLYGGRKGGTGPMLLHSHRLAIRLPDSVTESRFEAPIPADIVDAMEDLGLETVGED